jgi:hypothetical protein
VGIRQGSGSTSHVGGDPVRLEVITYAPTVFYHCQHCEVAFGQAGLGDRLHRDQARQSLPTDLRQEFAAVSNWIHHLLDRHGRAVDVRVIDAVSLHGIWKSLRYRTRTYPVVVVDGEDLYIGQNLSLAEADIERRVAAREEQTRAPSNGLED